MIQNLIIHAKRIGTNEKVLGKGINVIGDKTFVCVDNEWVEVDAQTVLLRAKNNLDNYVDSKTSNEDLNYLFNAFVQIAIDVCKEKGMEEIDEISFSVDSLKESIPYGEWTAGTDASMIVVGYQDGKRKIISEMY